MWNPLVTDSTVNGSTSDSMASVTQPVLIIKISISARCKIMPWFAPPSMASVVSTLVLFPGVHDALYYTKTMPIQFINGNKLKSWRMSLINHKWPISHHIMPLVINGLGADTQADRQTDRHTHTHTYIPTYEQK